MEWLEVRIIANKTVVQKNGVETLYGDWDSLKEKITFALFAARRSDSMTKGNEKDNDRAVTSAGIFKSNCLEKLLLLSLFSRGSIDPEG